MHLGKKYPLGICDLKGILARMSTHVDEIIRARRKTISIQIHADGKVIVRAPLRAPMRDITAFVESKSAWINEKRALMLQRAASKPVRQFTSGEKFWLLGAQIPLRVVEKQRVTLVLKDEFLLASQAEQLQSAIEFFKVNDGSGRSGAVRKPATPIAHAPLAKTPVAHPAKSTKLTAPARGIKPAASSGVAIDLDANGHDESDSKFERF